MTLKILGCRFESVLLQPFVPNHVVSAGSRRKKNREILYGPSLEASLDAGAGVRNARHM